MFPICILTGVIYSTINLAWTPELPMKETIEYLWAWLCPAAGPRNIYWAKYGLLPVTWRLDRVCWLLLSWQLLVSTIPSRYHLQHLQYKNIQHLHESKSPNICSVITCKHSSLPQSTLCSGSAPCSVQTGSWGRAREREWLQSVHNFSEESNFGSL